MCSSDLAANEGLPRKTLDADAAQLLSLYGWPGNVRELQNLMQRLAVLIREDVISSDIVRQNIQPDLVAGPASGGDDLDSLFGQWVRQRLAAGLDRTVDLHEQMLALVEPVLLRETLGAVDGNQIRAASLLGINRNTLRKKLNDYDIDPIGLRQRDLGI